MTKETRVPPNAWEHRKRKITQLCGNIFCLLLITDPHMQDTRHAVHYIGFSDIFIGFVHGK